MQDESPAVQYLSGKMPEEEFRAQMGASAIDQEEITKFSGPIDCLLRAQGVDPTTLSSKFTWDKGLAENALSVQNDLSLHYTARLDDSDPELKGKPVLVDITDPMSDNQPNEAIQNYKELLQLEGVTYNADVRVTRLGKAEEISPQAQNSFVFTGVGQTTAGTAQNSVTMQGYNYSVPEPGPYYSWLGDEAQALAVHTGSGKPASWVPQEQLPKELTEMRTKAKSCFGI